MPWLWIAAGAGLVPLAEGFRGPLAPWLGAVLAATLVVSAVREGNDVNEFNADQFNTLVDAAEEIETLAGGRPCGVVTGFTPQVAWYSGCRTGWYDLRRVAYPARMVEVSEVVYLLWAQQGKRQPDVDLWGEYVAASGGLVHREEGRRIVEVYLAVPD